MTVDSEAIFALARVVRRAMRRRWRSCAARWRRPGWTSAARARSSSARGVGRPLWIGTRPRGELLRIDEAGSRGRRAASSTSSCASARSARAGSLVIAGGRELGARALQARPQLRGEPAPGGPGTARGRVLPPAARRARGPLAVEPSVAAHGRARRGQTFADQELEGRPRALSALEHAVDLPFGEQSPRPGAAPRPSRRTSAGAPASARARRPAPARARASPPHRDVEPGLA